MHILLLKFIILKLKKYMGKIKVLMNYNYKDKMKNKNKIELISYNDFLIVK